MKIHHVALIVRDIDRSIHFYQKLGFSILNKTFRSERNSWKVDMKVGEVQLELFTFPDSPRRVSYPEAQGLRHLAFSVKNLEVFYAELKMKGIGLEEIRVDHLTGKKFFFFADPDDQPLEVYES